jgi:hypothetical protein
MIVRHMRKAFVAAAVVAAVGFMPIHGWADLSVNEYFADQETPQLQGLTHLWLSGVYQGLQSANVALISAHHPPLFCQPEKVALKDDQVAEILNRYLHSRHNNVGMRSPVVSHVLSAMQAEFPCPDKGAG